MDVFGAIINIIEKRRKKVDNSNIFKVWGERRRIHLDSRNEIDLLYLNKDCFCSTHTHKDKINKFIVIEGKVKIQTEFGQRVLEKNEIWEVRPPLKHRFIALEDSTMIEFAYVEKNKIISPDDINRISQGGKIIDKVEYTLEELRKRGLLDL